MPSKTFGNATEIAEWQSKADEQAALETNKIADLGQKVRFQTQYEMQRKWIADEKQAQLEYACLVYRRSSSTVTNTWAFYRLMRLNCHLTVGDTVPEPGKRYSTIGCVLMHPLSLGSVHISSSDPLAPPTINPNYLANPVDLEIVTKGLLFALKVFKTGPFAELVETVIWPKPETVRKALEDGDLEPLKEHAKSTCIPVYHPLGTAAMLPQDKGGVVDSSLKVYGTTSLRIVSICLKVIMVYSLALQGFSTP